MKKNRIVSYLIIIGLFLSLLLGLRINLGKNQSFLWLNNLNNSFFDSTMPYITLIGDGVFMVILSLALFIQKEKVLGLLLFITWAMEGLSVQIFKQFVFTESFRPWKVLAEQFTLHLVEGFTPHSNNSFPSGHTATVISMFLILSLYQKHNGIVIFYGFIAALVAYSRIYLSQHWIDDVLFGAIIGILSGLISIQLIPFLTKHLNKFTPNKQDTR